MPTLVHGLSMSDLFPTSHLLWTILIKIAVTRSSETTRCNRAGAGVFMAHVINTVIDIAILQVNFSITAILT